MNLKHNNLLMMDQFVYSLSNEFSSSFRHSQEFHGIEIFLLLRIPENCNESIFSLCLNSQNKFASNALFLDFHFYLNFGC